MIKTCANCEIEFTTETDRKTCSQSCAGKLARAVHRYEANREDFMRKDVVKPVERMDLPPVETLPAAYVKRVHDLWVSLTDNAPTRIA